jgi:hypothetical protein
MTRNIIKLNDRTWPCLEVTRQDAANIYLYSYEKILHGLEKAFHEPHTSEQNCMIIAIKLMMYSAFNAINKGNYNEVIRCAKQAAEIAMEVETDKESKLDINNILNIK